MKAQRIRTVIILLGLIVFIALSIMLEFVVFKIPPDELRGIVLEQSHDFRLHNEFSLGRSRIYVFTRSDASSFAVFCPASFSLGRFRVDEQFYAGEIPDNDTFVDRSFMDYLCTYYFSINTNEIRINRIDYMAALGRSPANTWIYLGLVAILIVAFVVRVIRKRAQNNKKTETTPSPH